MSYNNIQSAIEAVLAGDISEYRDVHDALLDLASCVFHTGKAGQMQKSNGNPAIMASHKDIAAYYLERLPDWAKGVSHE